MLKSSNFKCTLRPASESGAIEGINHAIVFYQTGYWAGWPANHGIWSWGKEILVGFTAAQHENKPGHTYNEATARHMFARSLDGGLTWSVEDAYKQGITGAALCHVLGDKAAAPQECPVSIDFTHPDFALQFTHEHFYHGPSCFYYSYDRGRSWQGPFQFPDLDTTGMGNRTCYLINGKHELLAFLSTTINHRQDRRAACARSVDGGRTWKRISWIGDENALMPAAVRLSPSKILSVIRVRPEIFSPISPCGLSVYLSEDNAGNWRKLDAPELGNLPAQSGDRIDNPPSLIKLTDGRLCLVYGVRIEPCRICARFSSDEGKTWSNEIILRSNDGACFDMGYTRVVQNPDGMLVVIYYYNHALCTGMLPYRFIAATIWDPDKIA